VVFLACLVYRSGGFACLPSRSRASTRGLGIWSKPTLMVEVEIGLAAARRRRRLRARLREAEISATQIKRAAPSHELTTSIPRQDASWLQGDFAICPFANSHEDGRPQAPIRPPEGGEVDALKGWFGGVRHAAGTRRIDVLLVTRWPSEPDQPRTPGSDDRHGYPYILFGVRAACAADRSPARYDRGSHARLCGLPWAPRPGDG
jgi:hypothetical protein